MPDLSLEMAKPVEADARQIMAWRNDPVTLASFFHTEPKVWGTFWPEYCATYFAQPDLPPLFLRQGGERVGVLRYAPVENPEGARGRTLDISVNIAPGRRGKGFGALGLRLGRQYVAGLGYDAVLAVVRSANTASRALFKTAGFRALGAAHHHVEDTGERAEVVRFLDDLTPPFWRRGRVRVIAEAGSNWRMGTPARDLAMGKALIDVAVEAGADCVKFQTYRPETVYVANAGQSDYLSDSGIKESISDIFADLAMPYDLVAALAAHCQAQDIAFMSTPFSAADFAAVDPHAAIHKVASYEISHPHLLRLAGESGKPLVLSTGASTEADIAWAVETFRAAGGRDLCLLQCTAKYPAPLDAMNLRTIPWLRARFGTGAGLSDHSRDPLIAPLAAVALGADVIEKHYTLDNRLPGPDHSFALLPGELQTMVSGIRAVEETLGSGVKTVLGAEAELAAYARRGVQALRAVAPGEVLAEGDTHAVLRPGKQSLGVHPRHLGAIEGQRARRALALGEGLAAGDWDAPQ
ncbi:MAG: GNAT family N-acetyltransferase [Pseudomonadota bacterium]